MSVQDITRAGLAVLSGKHLLVFPREHPIPPGASVATAREYLPYRLRVLPPKTKEEWDAYQWNPPAAEIRNPEYVPGNPSVPRYIIPTEPDTRPEVIEKPSWETLLQEGAPHALASDLCPWLRLTEAERRDRWEQLITREVWDADHPTHEHHVRERGGVGLDPDRLAWLRHLRHRFHELEHWVAEVNHPSFYVHWTYIMDLCAFDPLAPEVWQGLTWKPPTQVDVFESHSEVRVRSTPHPGPPPTWKPDIQRVSVGGQNVSFRVEVPLRAKVSFAAASGEKTFAVIYKGAEQADDFEIPHEVFPFTIRLNEGVRFQTVVLRYAFVGTPASGEWQFLVTRD